MWWNFRKLHANDTFPNFRDPWCVPLVPKTVDITQPNQSQYCIHMSLRWRHNGRDGVSNHQPHHCLLNRLLRRKSKKISKPRVTGLYAGIHRSPVNSPHKWPVTRKFFPFDDVIIVQHEHNSGATLVAFQSYKRRPKRRNINWIFLVCCIKRDAILKHKKMMSWRRNAFRMADPLWEESWGAVSK